MKYLKKSVSILLSFIMVFSLFTIIPVDAAAADGNAGSTDVSTCAQLQAVINASGGSHVRLAADITEQENDTAVLVGEGKTVTLDLNGFTLSRNLTENKDDGYVIRVNSGGALTVTDSSTNAVGKITGGYSKNGGGIYNLGTLTLEGGKLSGNLATENGGGVYNEGSVTVTGGSVINNSGKVGGGIYNGSTGVVALGGSGEVTANKSSESGGGIANCGTLSVSDNAEISCNYGYTNGGGILNIGTLTVNGGRIVSNSASKAGSGICNRSTLNMQGTPVVRDNLGDDVFLASDKLISVTGSFSSGASIGVSSASVKPVITSGYGSYNNASPSDYFFENGADCVSAVKSGSEVRLNTEGIPYVCREWDSEDQYVTKEIKHLTSYTAASGSLSELSGNNWYVVNGSVTISSRINNNGKANLLLLDGASIEFSGGIRNQYNMNSELNIFAQQEGTGKLTASGSKGAAIGAQDKNKNGTVNIYGGITSLLKNKLYYNLGTQDGCAGGIIRIYGSEVKCGEMGCGEESPVDTSVYIGIFNSEVNSSILSGAGVLDIYNSYVVGKGQIYESASIGGYEGCSTMGDINIYNSYIKATSQGDGAVIGSAKNCKGGNIKIVNSTVDAQSTKDNVYGSGTGAAIGSGAGGTGGNVVIENSCIIASGVEGAGIGGGKGKKADNVTITDSVVLACSVNGGAGIGGGDGGNGGNITIKRSNVNAKTISVRDPHYSGKDFSKAFYSISVEMMSKMVNGKDGSGSQVAYYFAGYLLAAYVAMIFEPTHGGAGIGGGDSAGGGTINIEDSKIVAKGGEYASGIGGGDDGSGGIINITDSNVTSTGGKDGAGIGGGEDGNGGTVTITDSEVYAKGKSYGAGIGCGEDGEKATVRIYGSSKVKPEAKAGSMSSAIGHGGYWFSYDGNSTYIDEGLLVKAGEKESSAKDYSYKDRVKAAENNNYAYIYPCAHSETEWRYINEANPYHRKYCTICGSPIAEVESHIWDDNNVCTVCHSSAAMFTTTYVEQNNDGEVRKEIRAPQLTEYIAPECTNVPDGYEFVCWCYNNWNFFEPGDVRSVNYFDATVKAVYMPTVKTTYIDERGTEKTETARRIYDTDYKLFLTEGWYVVDSDINLDSSIRCRGDVKLIISDGKTLSFTPYSVSGQDPESNAFWAMDEDNKPGKVTVYGQAQQTGKLDIGARMPYFYDFELNGGTADLTDASYPDRGNLMVYNTCTVNRGKLIADRMFCDHFIINGGDVEITDVHSVTESQLGWDELSDKIKLNYYDYGYRLHVADGQALKDENDNIYSGTLTQAQIEGLGGKELTPYIAHDYSEPEWVWSNDYTNAIAVFKCKDCDDTQEINAKVTYEDSGKNRISAAHCRFNGRDYSTTETFRLFFDVTVADSQNGSVSADRTEVKAGGRITLTVTPDERYAVSALYYTDSKGKRTDIEGNSFDMPGSDVTVTAEFELSDEMGIALPVTPSRLKAISA